MGLKRDLERQVIEVARDVADPEIGAFLVPRDKIAALAQVMAEDRSDAFMVVPRAAIEMLRDTLALYDRVRTRRFSLRRFFSLLEGDGS